MDLAKIVYWEVDIESHEFILNDPFYQMFRTTAEREGGYLMEVGEYAKRFVHPDDLNRFYANHRENQGEDRHAGPVPVRTSGPSPGRRGIHLLSRSRIIREASGGIIRIFGENQDITERKRSEESLRTSQSRLSEAMDIARLAYWEADGTTGTFMFNDVFYDLIGTTAEREGGYAVDAEQYLRKFVYPDDLSKVYHFVEGVRTNADADRPAELEARIIRGTARCATS